MTGSDELSVTFMNEATGIKEVLVPAENPE
jgi:hypothetical protein